MPAVEPLATKRSGIHDERVSTRSMSQRTPPAAGKSPRTRRRGKENQSPARRDQSDEFSDEDEDEVDRSTTHLTPGGLYPDLSPLSSRSGSGSPLPWSPEANDEHQTHNESFYSTRSHCKSRVMSHTPEKIASRDQPRTPEKGTQGRRVVGEPLDRNERRIRRGPTPLMVVAFTFLILLSLYWLKCQVDEVQEIAKQTPKMKAIDEVKSEWRAHFKHIVSMFRQEKPVWAQLHGQIDSILTDSPLQPAVLLVVAPEDSAGTAVCLIHTIAKAIANSFDDPNFIMYDMKSSGHTRSGSLLMELEESLQGLRYSHAAIVQNIEEIPGDAAMLFHGFCDNENAPFKQAVIFLMIEVSGKYEDMARGRLDTIIDNHLTQLWGAKLERKDVSAIVSRVANAPLLVKPEDREKVQMLCPV